jgi:chloramphenicol 3-O phosphotransferase
VPNASSPGRIVILNGAPRAGKSSIAHATQASLEGTWANFGVDAFMAMTPEHLKPGIGLRPGGERPDLEPKVQLLYRALFASIAAFAHSGVNVVADLGIHDDYSRPLGILRDATVALEGLPVLFVGVAAPIETIMVRRNADSRGGYYAAGDEVPAPVQRWQEAVHHHGLYDLTIDTAVSSPEQAAAQIERALADPPAPSAFEKLRVGA